MTYEEMNYGVVSFSLLAALLIKTWYCNWLSKLQTHWHMQNTQTHTHTHTKERKPYCWESKPKPLNCLNCPLLICVHDHDSFWRSDASRQQNCWTWRIPIQNGKPQFSRFLKKQWWINVSVITLNKLLTDTESYNGSKDVKNN